MAPTRFRRRRGAVLLTVHELEAPVLLGLLAQLADLVAPEVAADADPLAAMVGIGTATAPSDNPVLARLFPDAYADDPESSGEFRRYTENSLRERKHAAALAVIATLEEPGVERPLSPEEVEAWLGALTDLRLAIGTALSVDEDWEAQLAGLPPDHPARQSFEIYNWLSWLQETLLRCLP